MLQVYQNSMVSQVIVVPPLRNIHKDIHKMNNEIHNTSMGCMQLGMWADLVQKAEDT